MKKAESVHGDRLWSYRIPDTPFAGYKPADVVAVCDGQLFLLEFKMNRLKTKGLDLRKVPLHQLRELFRFKLAQGRSMIAVYDERISDFIFWEL